MQSISKVLLGLVAAGLAGAVAYPLLASDANHGSIDLSAADRLRQGDGETERTTLKPEASTRQPDPLQPNLSDEANATEPAPGTVVRDANVDHTPTTQDPDGRTERDDEVLADEIVEALDYGSGEGTKYGPGAGQRFTREIIPHCLRKFRKNGQADAGMRVERAVAVRVGELWAKPWKAIETPGYRGGLSDEQYEENTFAGMRLAMRKLAEEHRLKLDSSQLDYLASLPYKK
jgi:hypothetical protein